MSIINCQLSILNKLVLNNIRQHVLHLQAGSTNLLRNKAGSCHAWRGVHLKHGDFSFWRDDVVNADNAITMQNIINVTRDLTDATG